MEKTTFDTSGQSVQKSPEGLFLQDGIAGLRSLPRHSVDMLLTDQIGRASCRERV